MEFQALHIQLASVRLKFFMKNSAMAMLQENLSYGGHLISQIKHIKFGKGIVPSMSLYRCEIVFLLLPDLWVLKNYTDSCMVLGD